jgi:hypothetical protein
MGMVGGNHGALRVRIVTDKKGDRRFALEVVV